MTISNAQFAGKTAIVTGSSRGIGAAIARELAHRGANVVIVYASDKSQSTAAALGKELTDNATNKRAIAIQADLTGPAGVPEKYITSETLKAFPNGIDIVVNNVASVGGPTVETLTPLDFELTFRVNALAPLLLLQAALPSLNHPARIISISTTLSRRAAPGPSLLYAGSKAALESMSRVLAHDLGKEGTTVNCIIPGPVDTELLAKAPQQMIEMSKRMTPVENRVGTVEEIASVVCFLASEDAKWISGQCIGANGGLVML